jgi:uncharacterized protein
MLVFMNNTIEREESRKANDSKITNHGTDQEHDTLVPDRPTMPFEEADTQPRIDRPRGFAALSPERIRELASKGGKAAHAAGTAHQFNSEEGRAAGRKGGHATHAARRKAAERSEGG